MHTLTEKQSNFVLNYIKNGFNVYQACIDAGYSESFAKTKSCEMLKNPLINARVVKAYQQAEIRNVNKLAMTISEKAKVLDRIIRAIVPLDESQPVNLPFVKDAIKAISELNKMQGDYAPDKRLSITVDATQDRLNEARKVYEEY